MQSAYKCVVIGDEEADTTALLITFANKQYPEDYVPSVFDVKSVPVMVDNETISLSLWDMAKQESYDKIRQSGADVFIVCFSVDCPASFANVKSKWFDELTNISPGVPFIILGNNAERREDAAASIAAEQATALAAELRAHCYKECSMRNIESVQEVFVETARCAMMHRKRLQEKANVPKKCIIM